MNKEKIFALILGTIVGLGLGLFAIFGNKQNSNPTTNNIDEKIFNNQKPSEEQSDSIAESVDIVVEDQKNNKIISKEDKYTLKFTVPVDGLLVIVSNYDRDVSFVKSGNVSVDLNLAPAENTVKIVLYTMNNTFSVLQKDLKIYYFP
ncbi:MAG: hypothetical protein KatS3mg090_0312 [Patescibacteria group bacterium]|nr:MAG: hypothetical protein KatS3mg090_0312 [Patescibacteria group bacterium]